MLNGKESKIKLYVKNKKPLNLMFTKIELDEIHCSKKTKQLHDKNVQFLL